MSETKKCGRCKEIKPISEFYNCNQTTRKRTCYCKQCLYVKNKKYHDKVKKEKPWLSHFQSAKIRTKYNSHKRCSKYYYGLEFTITEDDIEKIWKRDKGYLLTEPSIDRIDSTKGYTPENTRFIELRLNSAHAKKVDQYDIYGKFIKTWDSLSIAAKHFNTTPSNIGLCAMGRSKSAKKYEWRYHNEATN